MCMSGWRNPAILTSAPDRHGDVSATRRSCCQNMRPRLAYWGLRGMLLGWSLPLDQWYDAGGLHRSSLRCDHWSSAGRGPPALPAWLFLFGESRKEADFLTSLPKTLHCVTHCLTHSCTVEAPFHYLKKMHLCSLCVYDLPPGCDTCYIQLVQTYHMGTSNQRYLQRLVRRTLVGVKTSNHVVAQTF